MNCRNINPIAILTYHQIAKAPSAGTPFRSLSVSPHIFERQMRLLKFLGYQGLSMSALLPYLRGEKEGRVVGITFDDGYQNNLLHAAPLLAKLGFSSTCYVVAGSLGQTNVWDHEIGIAQVPLMTVAELFCWKNYGQEVGAHTFSHANLTTITDQRALYQEVLQCRSQLQTALNMPIEHFCYPYGAYDQAAVAVVEAAGYLTATTTHRGRCHLNDNMMLLNRVPIVRRTHPLLLAWKIYSAYEDKRRYA